MGKLSNVELESLRIENGMNTAFERSDLLFYLLGFPVTSSRLACFLVYLESSERRQTVPASITDTAQIPRALLIIQVCDGVPHPDP